MGEIGEIFPTQQWAESKQLVLYRFALINSTRFALTLRFALVLSSISNYTWPFYMSIALRRNGTRLSTMFYRYSD